MFVGECHKIHKLFTIADIVIYSYCTNVIGTDMSHKPMNTDQMTTLEQSDALWYYMVHQHHPQKLCNTGMGAGKLKHLHSHVSPTQVIPLMMPDWGVTTYIFMIFISS